MKRIINEAKIRLEAKSENESVARSMVSVFFAELNPTVEEICDLRAAVSEAVTNSIVHAYKEGYEKDRKYIYISIRLYDNREISVEIADTGCGIVNVEEAMMPDFTSGGKEDERCGMGFLVMQSFTDYLSVKSKPGKGTTVLMKKTLKP
jgi:stage II sporulation protein AB (anti-sigma F factor)